MFKNSYFSIHYSFIILLILSFIFGLFPLLFIYFICLILHEGMHAFVAKKLGYKIGKIKLLFTGVMLEAESDEFSFKDEIKIAIAGPLFNLLISIFLLALWWIWPESYNYTLDLLVVNMAIFLFNILPIFPLDGGRVLLAFLSLKTSRKEAKKIVKTISLIFSLVILLLFIFSLFTLVNFSFLTAAITLFIGAVSEDKNAVYKRVFNVKKKLARLKRGLDMRYICAEEQSSVYKLYSMLDQRHYTIFMLVNENFKIVKTVSEAEVLNSINEKSLPLGKK